MEAINIGKAFRNAMRADGTHGVDPGLVTEGFGSILDRNYTAIRRKKDAWVNSFREAVGDICHTLRRDIEKIAENGSSPEKWSQVVSGDLTKHVTHGLTGRGGVLANFCIPTLKLPNGKKVHDIPLAWGICCQTNLFDLIRNKSNDLPSMPELLGTVDNTINVSAFIAGAKPYGTALYNDICSYVASGAGRRLAPATEYDEEKDFIFKESMMALFQCGWLPDDIRSMSGTISIICSQLFLRSFAFLAASERFAFTEKWYIANRHLWGWMNGRDPENEACRDFDALVKECLVTVRYR